MNLAIHYMYRDGANWKEFTHVIFTNPRNLLVADVEKVLFSCLVDGDKFVAENVGLPTAYLDDRDDPDAHGYHQFLSVKETEKEATDERSITRLLIDFAAENLRGWKPVRKTSEVSHV